MHIAHSARALGRQGLALLVLLVLALPLTACGLGSSPAQGSTTTLQPAPTPNSSGSTSGVNLGQLVMARSIDTNNHNAPVNATSSFNSTDTIYAVVPAIMVPSGTTLFARWSVNRQPTEDTSPITADRDYTNTNIEFHIAGTNGQPLPTGSWTVQVFVNGNPGPQANFQIAQ